MDTYHLGKNVINLRFVIRNWFSVRDSVAENVEIYIVTSSMVKKYNDGQNGCCLAYTSNLASNHFVHHYISINRFC